MIRFTLLACCSVLLANLAIALGDEPQLRQVSALWRHGDRTPGAVETYPTDPYADLTYYPVGRGGLTNVGKMREYQLGKVLKERYGDFLGTIYDPNVLVARTTDVDRTKMSLQLVLSALYPPEPIQEWNPELSWQPIPTQYVPVAEDTLLWPELCPQYLAEYVAIQSNAEVQEKISALVDIRTDIGTRIGEPIDGALELNALYHIFDAQRSANLTLPEWAWDYYPDGALLDGAALQYELYSYNDNLKRMFGGTLLRKITEDAQSYINGSITEGRKLYVYSAHELNVAAFQLTLGVFKPHVPAYSSAVLVELWEQDDEYFVKVLHYTGIPAEIVEKQIPGCSVLCPFDKFVELLEPVRATDADLLCTSDVTRKSLQELSHILGNRIISEV